jgi:predicted Zn finger-like uncharacterized protein
MYTQCPKCHALFVVTSQQLRAAEGMVRCGQCENVFNGREYVTFRKSSGSGTPEIQTGISGPSARHPLIEEQSTLSTRESVRDETSYEAINTPATQSPSAVESAPDTEPPQEHSRAQVASALPEFLVPELEPPEDRVGSRLLWGAGSICLAALLVVQIAWFNRHTLSSHDMAGPLIRSLCSHIDCDIAPRSDPDRITLVSRNVYTHPDHARALMISAVLRNDADFDQPPPRLLVAFSDLQGTVLAARLFDPGEYLPEPETANRLLSPGETVPLRLELLDPGGPTLNFEIEFH